MTRQAPPQAISFDVTGTLIHCPRLGSIYREVLARHGMPAESAAIRRAIGELWRARGSGPFDGRDRFTAHSEGERGFWRDFVDDLCERLGFERPSPFVAAELFHRFGRPDAWVPFADAQVALPRLRHLGYRLVVVSNWDSRLDGLLEGLGLRGHFDRVVTSSAVGFEKPDPRIFLEALGSLGIPAAAMLHVGDQRRCDVEGPRAVGIRALLLDRYSPRGDLGGLDRLVERLVSGETLSPEPPGR